MSAIMTFFESTNFCCILIEISHKLWGSMVFQILDHCNFTSYFQFYLYFLAANAQALNINVSHHVLARSKAEILHLVELLIESNRGELVDLLVDVVDIILHCIDHNHLKSRSLSEVIMFL